MAALYMTPDVTGQLIKTHSPCERLDDSRPGARQVVKVIAAASCRDNASLAVPFRQRAQVGRGLSMCIFGEL